MWFNPNPALNEEEQALLNLDPEGCLRCVIQRGALSLDQVTEGLSPQAVAAVRSITAGERLPVLPDDEFEPDDLERRILSAHPRLLRMLDERTLTIGEAYEAAHAIDRILGRYMTGTLYAAP
ncbi:MAG: hypothetical protein SXV54_00325 [Chloroflexota bacterium]|nr:hypothetical protein [Chloroflexota bacterium]